MGPIALPFANRVAYAQFLHDKSEVTITVDGTNADRSFLNIPLDKPPVEIPVIELTLRD